MLNRSLPLFGSAASEYRQYWARNSVYLGMGYAKLGFQKENIDMAITRLNNGLSIITQNTDWELWVAAKIQLAKALHERVTTNPQREEENVRDLESARASIDDVLRVLDPVLHKQQIEQVGDIRKHVNALWEDIGRR